MNRILLHNNCYGKYPLEVLFQKAKEFGYDGVELEAPKENIEEKSKIIREYKEKYGLKEIVVHKTVRTITDEDQKIVQQEIEDFIKFIPVVKKILGVKIINTMAISTLIGRGAKYIEYGKNGSTVAEEIHFQRAAETFRKIAPFVEKENVFLSFETHGCLIHDTVESTLKLVKMINSPNIKINLDYANLYLMPGLENIEKILGKLRNEICYMHIKNLRKIVDMPDNGDLSFFFTSIKEGEIDYRLIIQNLKNIGYQGPIALEYPGAVGDPDIVAKGDIIYMRDLLKEN